MIWEKFTCTSSFKGPQIRLVLNDSPFPLSICGLVSKRYGTCSLDDFLASTKGAQSIKWGDAAWNATCGASAF
jgi:acid phosphatase